MLKKFSIKPKYIIIPLLVIGLPLTTIYSSDALYAKLFGLSARFDEVYKIQFVQKLNYFVNEFDLARVLLRMQYPMKEKNYLDLKLSFDDMLYQKEMMERFLADGYMKDELKEWRKGKVRVEGKFRKMKYKFHGTSTRPIREYGKISFKIKHKKDSTVYTDGNVRNLNCIVGEEMGPDVIAANRIADKMGLIAPHGRMMLTRINGVPVGQYYMVEKHGKEWYERKFGITNYIEIKAKGNWDRKDYRNSHESDFDLDPSNADYDGTSARGDIALGRYEQLTKALHANDVARAKELVAVDYIAKHIATMTVLNDIHHVTGDNLRLIYDFTRGKFFTIYRQEDTDRAVYSKFFMHMNVLPFQSIPRYFESKTHKLFSVLLTDPEVRALRDKYMAELVYNEQELIEIIHKTHEENRAVLLHSDFPREVVQHRRWYMLKSLKQVCQMGRDYLEYGKMYILVDAETNTMTLQGDSFVPMVMTSPSLTDDYNGQFKVPGIQLDEHLELVYTKDLITLKDTANLAEGLVFVNTITGDTIGKEHIYVNFIKKQKRLTPEDGFASLRNNNINYTVDGNWITIVPGNYLVKESVVLPYGMGAKIGPGTRFRMMPGTSFLVKGNLEALGTAASPIIVERTQGQEEPFGMFGAAGQDESSYKVVMDHLKIDGGGETIIDGMHFTGHLAAYSAEVKITNSKSTRSSGDDGLNIKYGRDIYLESDTFSQNLADQIDLDFCTGQVVNCYFEPSFIDPNGDGLDMSGSYIEAKGCTFKNFVDKGVSVGERTTTMIHDCVFIENASGITIKDLSHVFAFDNKFMDNKHMYELYIKKKIFGAPNLHITEQPAEEDYSNVEGNIFIETKEELITNYKNAR